MFIKITRSKNYQYVQLVRSYRENGVAKHEVILNLGRLDTIENNPGFQRLALKLVELSKAKMPGFDFNDISEAEVVNWGYLVYRKLWEQFGLDKIFDQLTLNRKIQFSLNQACFLMALQHLLDPRSKLGTYQKQNRYIGMPEVELNHLYRSLDFLCIHKEDLEEHLFRANRNLFNMQVDMVFYDVTTFSFESVKADSLRDFGFSKNGKFNEVQVVMGLLIDCEGRPIGYELFPGNTFDGKTLETALSKMEECFGIRRVIIVADQGINSKLNLKKIADRGYSYIFSSRIKNMRKSVQKEILSQEGYQPLFGEGIEEEDNFRYKVISYLNRFKEEGTTYELQENLIVTYSSKRAKKDQIDRERLINKAQNLLKNKSSIKASNKRGGKKYLKETEDSHVNWILDEEAVVRDEMFDGYYGIQTNILDLPIQEIIAAHHLLWKIEESFRIMKSTLEVQPIFHWTESRIKGHFVVCFLAFLLERTLEFKLRKAGGKASPETIREALNSLNFAQVEFDHVPYLIKTKGTDLSRRILRLLRIRPPANIMPANEFKI